MESNDHLDRQSLELAAQGDQTGWQSVIARHHDRLRRMIGLRLDPRLRGRVDPSDVLQEVYLDATKHINHFLTTESVDIAPYLWLRQLAGTRLAKIHRHHLTAQVRDVRKELPLYSLNIPGISSMALVDEILAQSHDPGKSAARADVRDKIMAAIESLEILDREALILRHFEQLSSNEAAQVLGISQAAAGKRYIRALERLKEALSDYPGGLEALQP